MEGGKYAMVRFMIPPNPQALHCDIFSNYSREEEVHP